MNPLSLRPQRPVARTLLGVGRLRFRPFLSPELNARFQQRYREGGLAPTTFAVILGFIAAAGIYVVAGFTGFENVGWYEGIQAQRVHRLLFIFTILVLILVFWKYWKDRWTYVGYYVLLVIFGIGPLASASMGSDPISDVVAWRYLASQMICIVLAFTFLRLPLAVLVLTGLPSSVLVVVTTFDSREQMLVASSMLASIFVIGVAVWLTIYWRERLLFEQTVLIEAAAQSEKKYADYARRERRSLIHDIRQPMSAFAINMGILRTSEALNPELEHKLSTLRFAFDALKGQVDEFARESLKEDVTGLSAFTLQRVNIIEVLSNTVLLHEPLAASKSIEFTAAFSKDNANTIVRTNLVQISNVLQLLVGNAIKFNANARVRLSCRIGPKTCSIYVTDTGQGIAPANLEKIFDAGFSTGDADTHSQGLGLFSVRRIIASLPGHRIQVRSRVSQYTSFRLNLPLATRTDKSLKDVRVLVVDDEPTIASGLATLFEGSGAFVATATSAAQASKIIDGDDQAFELLVCDFDLGSGANGIELIESVRAFYNERTPAFLVTGRRTQVSDVPDSVHIVRKPFDAVELLDLAEECSGTKPSPLYAHRRSSYW